MRPPVAGAIIISDGPEMTICSLRESVDNLKAIAHPVRLRILALLRGGELCVCQITEILGLAPSTVSEHLSLLRRAGLIVERREGKWVIHGLAGSSAYGPLLAALWPLVDGDAALEADEDLCGRVREIPLTALCRVPAGAPQERRRLVFRDASGGEAPAAHPGDCP